MIEKIFYTLWPLFLIAAGILFVNKRYWLGVLTIVVLCILAVLFTWHPVSTRIIGHKIDIDDADEMMLKVKYGGGTINISGGADGLAELEAYTADEKVGSKAESLGNKKIVSFYRTPDTVFSKDSWEIKLNNEVQVSMKLEYGAAKASIDLSGMNVPEIEINTGASSSRMIFDKNTQANINAGASSIELVFPEDKVVQIVMQGMISKELKGFEKRRNSYYRGEGKPDIFVVMEAGISSIKTDFLQSE